MNVCFVCVLSLLLVGLTGCKVDTAKTDSPTNAPAVIEDKYDIRVVTDGIAIEPFQPGGLKAVYHKELAKMCAEDDIGACKRLSGDRKSQDRTTPRPYLAQMEKLRDHLSATCEGGEGESCYELSGLLYQEFGVGGEPDPTIVTEYDILRLKSCDLGYAKACDYLDRVQGDFGGDYRSLIREKMKTDE